ncbi:hypothetical protein N9C35_04240 [Flavobacteriaceae bacterium]|nr:hypothetical protein [Flavobacteriaceae bacterium]
MTKWQTVGTRITTEEKEIIEKRAKDNNMSVSEYIKNRILYDPQESNESINNDEFRPIDKDIILEIRKTYLMLTQLCQSENIRLPKNVLERVPVAAKEYLARKGYM